jgi:hypothetical protein
MSPRSLSSAAAGVRRRGRQPGVRRHAGPAPGRGPRRDPREVIQTLPPASPSITSIVVCLRLAPLFLFDSDSLNTSAHHVLVGMHRG